MRCDFVHILSRSLSEPGQFNEELSPIPGRFSAEFRHTSFSVVPESLIQVLVTNRHTYRPKPSEFINTIHWLIDGLIWVGPLSWYQEMTGPYALMVRPSFTPRRRQICDNDCHVVDSIDKWDWTGKGGSGVIFSYTKCICVKLICDKQWWMSLY